MLPVTEACQESAFVRALAASPIAEKVRAAVLLHLPEQAQSLHLCIEGDLDQDVSQDDLLDWDLLLRSGSKAYNNLRESGCLKTPTLHRAPRGAFHIVRERFARSVSPEDLPGVSASQVKMPLILRGRFATDLLDMCCT